MTKVKITSLFVMLQFAFVFAACDKNKGNDPIDISSMELIESFTVTTASGSNTEASIDISGKKINIANIANGAEISSVSYQLIDGTTIYPDPNSRVADWKQNEAFILTKDGSKVTYTAVLTDFNDTPKPEVPVETDGMIYPKATYGRVVKHFGFDLKDNNNRLDKMENANEMFITQDLDAIRVPIWGVVPEGQTDMASGHPAPGQINSAIYDKYVTRILNAKAARGAGDFTVFASKKIFHSNLDGEVVGQFPSWVQPLGTKNLLADKYAQMIGDYIAYFKSKGIIIDVLGLDNEGILNKAITAQKHVDIVHHLRDTLTKRDLKMPLIVGRESWDPDPQHNQWLKDVIAKDETALDIYGVHYYPDKDHPSHFDKLQNEINTKGSRPFWATEPHWNSQKEIDESIDGDMLLHSDRAMCCLWTQADLGMDAFIWWAYNNTDNGLRGQLMEIASVPLHGAQPIHIYDADDTQKENEVDFAKDDVIRYAYNTKLKTRAFIEDNLVTVYIQNVVKYADRATGKSYSNYTFGIDEMTIDGDITYHQWVGKEDAAKNFTVERDVKIQSVNDKNYFSIDIPVRSITSVQFKVK